MKKASLLLLLNLLNIPSIQATSITLEDNQLTALTFPYLDEQSLMTTRIVSKALTTAVERFVEARTKDSLNSFDVYSSPLLKLCFSYCRDDFFQLLHRQIKKDGFTVIYRGHPFEAHFSEYAQDNALERENAQAIVAKPEFKNNYDAMIWEEQTDAIVYGQNLKSKQTALQNHFNQKIATSKGKYITFDDLSLQDDLPDNARFLLTGEDFYSKALEPIKDSLRQSPRHAIVADISDGMVFKTSHPLWGNVDKWIFTNTNGKSTIGDWFLSGADLLPCTTLKLPTNLSIIGKGFLSNTTIHAGTIVELPGTITKIESNFMQETIIKSDLNLILPSSLKKLGGAFLFQATLPLGFTVELPAGLKIENQFMSELKIPTNSQAVGLQEILEDLNENEGYLSKPMEVTIETQKVETLAKSHKNSMKTKVEKKAPKKSKRDRLKELKDKLLK